MPPSSSDKTMSNKARRIAANKALNSQTGVLGGDMKMVYGIAVLSIFLLVGLVQFITLLGDLTRHPRGVTMFDVEDHSEANIEKMKEVFFSGKPYVMYCVDDTSADVPSPPIIKEVVSLMNKDSVAKEAQFLQANCFKPLPTGKTISERFNFGKNPNFIAVFGEANSEKPLQLNYLNKAEAIVTQMKTQWTNSLGGSLGGGNGIKKVTYLNDFEAFKRRQRNVVLLGKDGAKRKAMTQMMGPMLKAHTGLKAYMVDSSFYHLSLDKDFLELSPQAPKKSKKSSSSSDSDSEDAPDSDASTAEAAGDSDGDSSDSVDSEDKLSDKDSAFGEAVCFIKITEPEKIDALGEEIIQKRSAESAPEGKKTIYKASWLTEWNGENIVNWLNSCVEVSGSEHGSPNDPVGEDGFKTLARKPRLAAIPSKPKVVSANSRVGETSAGGSSDGLKQGGGERVGRRQEEELEDLDDLETTGDESVDEETVEDVDL